MLALAASAAGCNSGGETSSANGTATTAASAPSKLIERNPANAAKTVTVGAAGSQEQMLLGEIYAQALRAAGYKVKLSSGSFKALRRGRVDGYLAYTGSALVSLYAVPAAKVPTDPDTAFAELQRKLASDKLVALAPTPFENSYQLAMTKRSAAKAGNPSRISGLAGRSAGLVASGPPGCARRPDCLVAVERAYRLRFRKLVATPNPYRPLDKGAADVAFVRSTDAALATPRYVPLTDDRHAFAPGNATFLIRQSRLRSLGPDVRRVIELVQAPLSVEVQRELNARVAIDGKTPQEVATEYLKQAALVK